MPVGCLTEVLATCDGPEPVAPIQLIDFTTIISSTADPIPTGNVNIRHHSYAFVNIRGRRRFGLLIYFLNVVICRLLSSIVVIFAGPSPHRPPSAMAGEPGRGFA